MKFNFMTIVYGLIGFVVGAVVIMTVLPALLPSLYGGLNVTHAFSWSTNHTGTMVTYTLPLANLFALNGIIPLLVVVAVFVGLIIGAVAIAGMSKKR